ncbi:helix-turn-helix domain-containing protein [Conexibacter woesei]|uniref:helix-turn-helix domain-containing protein n=1 Tax=Conexibacter woesei TaxID=191495 RepID=UPI0003FD7690|nr:helix-turn-helix transcriptional regulator [Conexibacter woesei]
MQPPDEILARNLRKVRDQLDLSQEAVAAGAGMSARAYQRLESGRSNPTLRTLVRVAASLRTTVAALTHGVSPDPEAEDPAAEPKT